MGVSGSPSMNRISRQTKIVVTIGPASSAPEVIASLIAAGVDVFRLNFSHGTHDSHAAVFRAIKGAAARANRPVGIMQDLSGPKIRTGPLIGSDPIPLRDGDSLRILAGDEPSRPGVIYTPFAPLIRSARKGDRLLLDGSTTAAPDDGTLHRRDPALNYSLDRDVLVSVIRFLRDSNGVTIR